MDSFGHQVVKIPPKQNANGDGPLSVVFFFGEFSQPGVKKKGDFWDLKKKIAIYWPKKFRSRQI